MRVELALAVRFAMKKTNEKIKARVKQVFIVEQVQSILHNENGGLVVLLQKDMIDRAAKICKTIEKNTRSNIEDIINILSEYLVEKVKTVLNTLGKHAFVENFRKLVKRKTDMHTLIKKSFKVRKRKNISNSIESEFSKAFNDEKVIKNLSVFLDKVLKKKL